MLQSHHHIKLQIQLKIILLQQKVDQIELELGPRVSGRDCVALGGEEKDGTEKVCGRPTDDGRASEVV